MGCEWVLERKGEMDIKLINNESKREERIKLGCREGKMVMNLQGMEKAGCIGGVPLIYHDYFKGQGTCKDIWSRTGITYILTYKNNTATGQLGDHLS